MQNFHSLTTCTRITTIFVSHESFPLDTSGIHNNSALNGNGCRTIKLRVVNFSETLISFLKKGFMRKLHIFTAANPTHMQSMDSQRNWNECLERNRVASWLHEIRQVSCSNDLFAAEANKKASNDGEIYEILSCLKFCLKLGLFVKSVNRCSVVEFDEFVVCLCCRTWHARKNRPAHSRNFAHFEKWGCAEKHSKT